MPASIRRSQRLSSLERRRMIRGDVDPVTGCKDRPTAPEETFFEIPRNFWVASPYPFWKRSIPNHAEPILSCATAHPEPKPPFCRSGRPKCWKTDLRTPAAWPLHPAAVSPRATKPPLPEGRGAKAAPPQETSPPLPETSPETPRPLGPAQTHKTAEPLLGRSAAAPQSPPPTRPPSKQFLRRRHPPTSRPVAGGVRSSSPDWRRWGCLSLAWWGRPC